MKIIAKGISSVCNADKVYDMVPQFRKSFSTSKKIKSATAYITVKVFKKHKFMENGWVMPFWLWVGQP